METRDSAKNFLGRGVFRPFSSRPGSNWKILLPVAAYVAFAAGSIALQGTSPHLDPDHGVLRIMQPWAPRGSCNHCHDMHSLETGESPYPYALFAENANGLCYTTSGTSPCHQAIPSNYPADEQMRIPEGFPDAGYFEYNSAGSKIWGVEYRARWTGQVLYDNSGMVGGTHFFSPHRNDPDMPLRDPYGAGSCLNCHNPHGSENPFDMLVAPYRGIGGFDEPTVPSNYTLCFDCHSNRGPGGMDETSKRIEDFYNSAINSDGYAGHQIRMDPDVAISWPSHIRAGDKLPCYDCHNPHGSRGYNGEGANAFLISDQRQGWSNLTDTLNDPVQTRRFCFGCHIPSDGVPGSQTVEGILMNTLPDKKPHRSSSTDGCTKCHGGDYSSPTSYNVHHPKGHG